MVDGKFELKVDVDDTVLVKAFMLNLQGNQYKRMFEKDLGGYCEAMYKDAFEDLFNDIHKSIKKKVAWKTCPYPKGEVEIINLGVPPFNQDLLPPYLPGSEKWQGQLRFYQNGIELGGYNVYLIVRTEKTLFNGGKK